MIRPISITLQFLNFFFNIRSFLGVLLLLLLYFVEALVQLVYPLLVIVWLLESAVWWQGVNALLVDKVLSVALYFIVDALDHVRSEPLKDFPIFPEAILNLALRWFLVLSKAMLLAVGPEAGVSTAVVPDEYAVTMLLIV